MGGLTGAPFGPAARWWVSPQPRPAAPWRLICFPHAGGDATAYHAWAAALPAHIELAAVRLPGRGARLRDPAFTRLEPLLAVLRPALAPLSDKKLALFGHSLGGLLAFELARAWQAEGGPTIEHLFVSGSRAPMVPSPHAPLHTQPDSVLRDYLSAQGGTPPELLAHAELMALMLPILRADLAIRENYTFAPGPMLTCPITALGGEADANNPAEALLPWQAHTSGAFRLRLWPGGHFYLHAQAAAVVATIADALPA